MGNTAELTEKYLSEHPSIKDCLKNGVINYSKLSRKIGKELGIEKQSSMEAILIACRRYAVKLKKEKLLEEKILRLLKQSELEIKNKIVVVVVDKRLYMEHLLEVERKIRKSADVFYAIEGASAFTVIVSEKYAVELEKLFKQEIMGTVKNLAMIRIRSSEEMESTPGVMSYLFSLFGEHGVNVVETMSCWCDTIFVVSEGDIPKIMQFLKF